MLSWLKSLIQCAEKLLRFTPVKKSMVFYTQKQNKCHILFTFICNFSSSPTLNATHQLTPAQWRSSALSGRCQSMSDDANHRCNGLTNMCVSWKMVHPQDRERAPHKSKANSFVSNFISPHFVYCLWVREIAMGLSGASPFIWKPLQKCCPTCFGKAEGADGNRKRPLGDWTWARLEAAQPGSSTSSAAVASFKAKFSGNRLKWNRL